MLLVFIIESGSVIITSPCTYYGSNSPRPACFVNEPLLVHSCIKGAIQRERLRTMKEPAGWDAPLDLKAVNSGDLSRVW